MKGTREITKYFTTEQVGRLYITVGRHARGHYVHIQVLPEDEKAIPNGSPNMCRNPNAVEVFGVVSGDPGWTETYGWLKRGPWVSDFDALLNARREERRRIEEAHAEQARLHEVDVRKYKASLLATYEEGDSV